eukprot:TRINITY_DN5343_c0_g1_i5.p1 TRINITY_DN5343_c0_g1~~TRINITY_DN5343_c0_g1_i5.p1  ORF type:complete len:396 (+),score=91.44 TRINITY_DN5343_c0_g1_i5:443-1630(+)
MFNEITSYVYESLVVKFLSFQSESKLMVPMVVQSSETSRRDVTSTSKKTRKGKSKSSEAEILLSKSEQGFLDSIIADEKALTEYKELVETQSQGAHSHLVEFVGKVDAFQKKFISTKDRVAMNQEATQIYNLYFKETTKELPISPTVKQAVVSTFSENPNFDSQIFYSVFVHVVKFLYNGYKKKSRSQQGKKRTTTAQKRNSSVTPEPTPHIVQREMFNIYPDGSPDQILWDLLADDVWSPKFRVFMEKEYATENLNCWTTVQAFRKKYRTEDGKNINMEELVTDALSIYKRFIARGCPELVNINSRDSQALHRKFQSEKFPEGIDQNVFNACQLEVFRMMSGNHYRKFKEEEKEKAAYTVSTASESESERGRRKKKPEGGLTKKTTKAKLENSS